MAYEVVWNGDIRGPHRGQLCVMPDAEHIAWIRRTRERFTPRHQPLGDAIALLDHLLRRHLHVCLVPALVEQSQLTRPVVKAALRRLVTLDRARQVLVRRPRGRAPVIGYRARWRWEC